MRTSPSELFEGDWRKPEPDPRLLLLVQSYKDEYRDKKRDLKNTHMTQDQKHQVLGQILSTYRKRVQEEGLDYWTFLELCQKG